MSKANRGRTTPKAPKHAPFKPITTYDIATVFGLLEEVGGIERVADDYDTPADVVRTWAVHGHIPNGWHLRMFARLCAMEKTVDPAVFGFREEDKPAVALTRLTTDGPREASMSKSWVSPWWPQDATPYDHFHSLLGVTEILEEYIQTRWEDVVI